MTIFNQLQSDNMDVSYYRDAHAQNVQISWTTYSRIQNSK